ncbi:ABC transporter permease [Leifsonia kafniensis]|uniref:ABC transporter permease n=1 Tax=Leifsonia kafniensis TaxID=475957 RepID=A0ABP7KUM8_9MICO
MAEQRTPSTLFRLDGSISARTYTAIAIAMFVLVGVVWWAIAASGIVKPIFLPSPGAVAGRLAEQVANGQLMDDIGVSVLRILGAFLVSAALALPLGLLMGRIRFFEALFVPITEFIRYMPVVAFTPLTIVWVGVGELQKLVLIFIGTFFALLLMIMDNVHRTPREYVESGRTFGMSETRILWRIVLRAAFPTIWDSFRLALGWCWTWLVLGELLTAGSGLGFRITLAQRFLDTELIFGYILVLGLLGLITDQVMRLAGRLMFTYAK